MVVPLVRREVYWIFLAEAQKKLEPIGRLNIVEEFRRGFSGGTTGNVSPENKPVVFVPEILAARML
jgi:hypothetical protein